MNPRAPTADPAPEEAALHGGERQRARRRLRLGLSLFGAVVGLAVGLVVVALAVDLGRAGLGWEAAVQTALGGGGLERAVEPLAEVMAAMLGLSLTVVAIVVQLASQRYPAKIVDLFMHDRINLLASGCLAASCIYVMLVPVFAGATPGELRPTVLTALALVVVVLNFGMLLPYFGHVFAFLEPHNLITQIRAQAETALREVAAWPAMDDEALRLRRERVAGAIERIADNCTAAVGQSDRALALHTVRTLEGLIADYVERKVGLPARWAEVERRHFGTLARDFFEEIGAHNTWVEAKTMLEFERIFIRAAQEMNALASQIAASTRGIGLRAMAYGQLEVLTLTVRFFNTYLRHAINSRNVRAVYIVLYEYRRLATALIPTHPEFCLRIAEHMIYYGRTANAQRLAFATVTAAHDVRVICQQAYLLGGLDMDQLLDKFLQLDQPADSYAAEVALGGVRKAQAILAAFFMAHEQHELARRILHDMQEEDPDRLRTIRDEILDVRERRFWEMTERGFNFDYVEPELRRHVVLLFDTLLGRPTSSLPAPNSGCSPQAT